VSPPLASARRLATPTPVPPFGASRTYDTSPGTAPSSANRSGSGYGSGSAYGSGAGTSWARTPTATMRTRR
jgi:hypothetical protein